MTLSLVERRAADERSQLEILSLRTSHHLSEVRHILWLVRELADARTTAVLRIREDALCTSLTRSRAALEPERKTTVVPTRVPRARRSSRPPRA
jgi:hypothetical protein